MNINKINVIGSIIVILLIITIPTIYKVVKNHQSNLYQVVEQKIINKAKVCYYEEKCNDDKIYLKDLYELGYLDKINNPVSKEYYNEESYVERKDKNFKFIVVE